MHRRGLVPTAILALTAALGASGQLSSSYNINTPSDVSSTICGDIVNLNLYDEQIWFYASDVLQCFTSLPFLPDVGHRFITWWNNTLQYQASSAYLRNPPTSYQQPAVDLFGGLTAIRSKINAGYYKNHYAFEVDVQTLSQQTHDIHAVLWGGATGPWTFSAPFYLTTVSTDGHQTPKIYIHDDLVECATPGHSCSYSAIAKINGVPIVDYLTDFAARQSYGYVEPDADWQNLMFTPAQALLLAFNAFTGSATFYPGDDLIVTFENKTDYSTSWIALYASPGFTGPLATAGDYYNFFVLGLPPANYDDTLQAYLNATASLSDGDNSTDTTSNTTSTYDSWTPDVPAYPKTMSHQENLGLYSSGFVTGYFLDDIKTAVLSIPSFDEYGDDIGTFSASIGNFISNATDRGAQKIIIDVQQNLGGQVALAHDVFRWFFPKLTAFGGSRRRSFRDANLIGDATTRRFDQLNTSSTAYSLAVSSEWVATELLDARTGRNFSSWAELYGPERDNGDSFSRVQRYNLSSPLFNSNFLGVTFPDCFYDHSCPGGNWTGKDIIILSDGLCTSACTLFVEMMVKDGGAHSVVVGGRPQSGPMQTASGSRGAASYSRNLVDADIASISRYNTTVNSTLTPYTDSGMSITFAGFTLRDQIRNGSTVPNQYRYFPADCRLYWSLANFNNYTRLWHDTYNGIFHDTSICVPGSRNVTEPPKRHNARAVGVFTEMQTSRFILGGLASDSHSSSGGSAHGGVADDSQQVNNNGPLTFCDPKKPKCPRNHPCVKINWTCQACTSLGCTLGKSQDQYVCQPTCVYSKTSPGQCGDFFTCRPDNSKAPNKSRAPSPSGTATKGARNPAATGNTPTAARSVCEPNINNGNEYCDTVNYELDDLRLGYA